MFLDASAIVAIIAQEPDAADLAARLSGATEAHTSPIAIYEAAAALGRIGRVPAAATLALIDALLRDCNAVVTPITPAIGLSAIAAFDRYGKGRHRAALNLGDCFAYACTRALNTELLCKGDDFGHTDAVLA